MARTKMSATGKSDPRAGFSLLELMVVMAVVAVVAALALPVIRSGSGTADVRSSATKIANSMRVARSEALVANRSVIVSINVAEGFIDLLDERRHYLPEGVSLTLFTAQSELVSEDQGQVRFYPDGSSTGGAIRLSPLNRPEFTETVAIDWLTGRVTLSP